MISLFTNFFVGHQTVLLIGLIIASILYLLYNHSYLYNIKINFKNFCFNSDSLKINIDTPSCKLAPIIRQKSVVPIVASTSVGSPTVASTSVASTTVGSPTVTSPTIAPNKNIVPNIINTPIKTTNVSSVIKS